MGAIAVAVGSERQWRRFFSVLDLPDVAIDPRFGTNGHRVEHRAALRPILAARFLERDRASWLAALEGSRHPVRADPATSSRHSRRPRPWRSG